MKEREASMKFSGIASVVIAVAMMTGLVIAIAPHDATAAPPSVDTSKPYSLELYTVPTGFPEYAISVAVADLINKNSKWLKATALEGRGPTEALKYAAINVDKRTNFMFMNQQKFTWAARQGTGGFKKSPEWDNFRGVALMGASATGLCTVDAKIKTWKDLKGKKIVLDSGPGRARQILFEGVFKEMGVAEGMKFEYMAGPRAADAMKDGLIDATYASLNWMELPDKWVINPYITELVTSKPTYFISIPEDHFKAFKKKSGHPDAYRLFPPKTASPMQEEPFGTIMNYSAWAVHKDMPDEVITEFLRVLYENADKVKSFTPFGGIISKETLGTMDLPEKEIHPAAVKFFKQKGIPIVEFP